MVMESLSKCAPSWIYDLRWLNTYPEQLTSLLQWLLSSLHWMKPLFLHFLSLTTWRDTWVRHQGLRNRVSGLVRAQPGSKSFTEGSHVLCRKLSSPQISFSWQVQILTMNVYFEPIRYSIDDDMTKPIPVPFALPIHPSFYHVGSIPFAHHPQPSLDRKFNFLHQIRGWKHGTSAISSGIFIKAS